MGRGFWAAVGAWLAAIVVGVSAAAAEPVYIEGNESVGQGWVFKRGDACLVLTAGHVAQVGAVVTSVRRHPDGRPFQAQAVSVRMHPRAAQVGEGGVDLAILVLEGALKAQCPVSQLGYAALGPTLDRIQRNGLPVVMTRTLLDTGIASTPVRLHTINADGVTFVVDKAIGASGALQGDSGSALQLQSGGVGESGLPLGLVVQTLGDSGLIRVVRFDVARVFVEREFLNSTALGASPRAPNAAAPARASQIELVDFVGATPDPACGPSAAISAGSGCGWKSPLLGGRRFADLVLTAPGGFPRFSGLQAMIEGGGGSFGIEVSTSDAPANETAVWTTASVCRGVSGGVISCRFAPRTARTVRLRAFGNVEGLRGITLVQD
jgi:hypothetical protein